MRALILAILALLATPAAAQMWGTLPDTTPTAAWPSGWDTSHAGSTINTAGMTVGWHASFLAGSGNSCLDAVTGNPAIGLFTDAAPTPGFDLYAYSGGGFTSLATGGVNWSPSAIDCAGNTLNIHLSWTGSAWQSGAVISTDKWGTGESARFGYFYQRVLMPAPPAGMVPWPSTWYDGRWPGDARWSYTEIDPMELGRLDATPSDGYIHEHNWVFNPAQGNPTGQLAAHRFLSVNTTASTLDGAWHTYGMLVTPRVIVVYWDGVEVARTPVKGMDQILRWDHQFDVSMYLNPSVTTTWTASVSDFYRMTCTPFPGCLDNAHS